MPPGTPGSVSGQQEKLNAKIKDLTLRGSQEIVEDLEAALEQFREIVGDLGVKDTP